MDEQKTEIRQLAHRTLLRHLLYNLFPLDYIFSLLPSSFYHLVLMSVLLILVGISLLRCFIKNNKFSRWHGQPLFIRLRVNRVWTSWTRANLSLHPNEETQTQTIPVRLKVNNSINMKYY